MENEMIVRDDAGVEWSQQHDPVSGRTTLTRITPFPHTAGSTRPRQVVRIIEEPPTHVPGSKPEEETREVAAYKYLLSVNANSAADAAERLRTVMTQLTPGEIQRAVDAYLKARLS